MALITCPDCGAQVSDAAPACPKCGRPIASGQDQSTARTQKNAAENRKTNTRAKLALGVIAIIIALAWLSNKKAESLSGSGVDSTDSPTQEATPAAPEIEVTPDQLQDAYDTNEVAADNIYKGKVIRIVGKIASIDKDFTDVVVIQLATRNQFMHVSASMIDAERGRSANLRKGQSISVDCERVMRVIGTPAASKCRFSSAQ